MMHAHLKKIQANPLFVGIKENEIQSMFRCLGAYIKSYKKDEITILPSDKVKCVGLILTGGIDMVKENEDGDEILLADLKEGELFGETFACGTQQDSSLTFRAAADTEVLFLPFYKVLNVCTMSCPFHHRLTENMVRMICEKNIRLMEKVEVISRKTLRDKILTYLAIQSEKQGSRRVEVPLGRTEMAEYLCADRSALTRELSRMQEDGLIWYEKRTFWLCTGRK